MIRKGQLIHELTFPLKGSWEKDHHKFKQLSFEVQKRIWKENPNRISNRINIVNTIKIGIL